MYVHYLEYHVYSCLLYVYQAFNKNHVYTVFDPFAFLQEL